MPLSRVQTLLQHRVAVSDRSFVLHPRRRRRHHHRSLQEMVIQRCGVGAHVVTHGLQELHRCIRPGVIAIDAGLDALIVQETPLSSVDGYVGLCPDE